MTFNVAFLPKNLVRASAVLLFAIGASACSSVPNWVDPTNWIGGSDDQAPAPDENAQAADNGQSPDLSTIPDKPNAPSTDDEQKQVAQSLASDRSRAQYSADALKGGTEPAAAPPPAEAATPSEDVASNDNAAPPPAPPPPPRPQQSSGPGTLPSDNPQPSEAAPPPQPAPQTQVASAETVPPAAPQSPPVAAVPAVPAIAMSQVAPTDAALGFKASTAPPLDASVAQFVPASIMARYRQTASIGPQPAVPTQAIADDGTTDGSNLVATSSRSRRHRHTTAMGGPERMSGAVVANFDALQAEGANAGPTSTPISGGPAAVVLFQSDTTVLDFVAREQVRAAAKTFMAQGGQGYVRVIGHSSSRTGSLSAARSLVWNFERSQARANAVARALIGAGVPPEKVLVQAVGDGQSSAPAGEDGGRRAEIFFES